MSEIVYLNGEFMPLQNARIPVLDRGFIFGDSVYEVIPVYSRHPFRLPEHLARLQQTMRPATALMMTATVQQMRIMLTMTP